MTTIYDIAKAAGITATTVSNVLTGKGSVSVATRERVLQVAKDLGYAPNLVARSLIKGRTGVIGFIVPGMDNPFYAEIATEVERFAYAAGLRVLTTTISWGDHLGTQLLKDLILRRVDGLLVVHNNILLQTIRSVTHDQLPLVLCLREKNTDHELTEEDKSAYRVSFDFFQAGQLAAQYLLSEGHQRVGFIPHLEGDGQPQIHHERSRGFLTTMAAHDHDVDPALIVGGNATFEGGRIAGNSLLSLAEPPTAIFATNDVMAIGVMRAAWECGLHVPRDLSVIGMDDISLAAYTSPPLTTIKIDKTALMAKAVEMLLQAIEGKPVIPELLAPPALVVRHSTASYLPINVHMTS